MKKLVIATLLLGISGAYTGTAAAESVSYDTNGIVNFMPSTDPADPVNPLDPDPDNPVKPIDPTDPDGPSEGTKGPLSIDYVSSFDFGVNKISNKTQTYYARAQTYTSENEEETTSTLVTPNYVQISDNRGTNGGWTLKVKQNGQLKNANTLNSTLTGAEIKLVSPVVKSNAQGVTAPTATTEIVLDPAGTESVVFAAKANAGAGTWVNAWGSKVETVTEKDENDKDVTATINKEVSLTIPGKTPKDAVKYATTLTWSLSDVPSN